MLIAIAPWSRSCHLGFQSTLVHSLTEPVGACFPNFPSVLDHPELSVAWVKIFRVCTMNAMINTIIKNCDTAMFIS